MQEVIDLSLKWKKIIIVVFFYFYAVMNFQHFLDAGSEATCIIKYFFWKKIICFIFICKKNEVFTGE